MGATVAAVMPGQTSPRSEVKRHLQDELLGESEHPPPRNNDDVKELAASWPLLRFRHM